MIGFIFILALNFAISWWNCYVVGRSWAEAKAIGGWVRLVAWSGAIMAAAGFSMVYLALLAFGLYGIGYLDTEAMGAVFALWGLIAIPLILGSGTIITIESWRVCWRERNLLSLANSAWNTYATTHNTLSAFNGMGSTMDTVVGFATDGDDIKETGARVSLVAIFLIVVIALLAGTLHAAILIKKYAATLPMPVRETEQAST